MAAVIVTRNTCYSMYISLSQKVLLLLCILLVNSELAGIISKLDNNKASDIPVTILKNVQVWFWIDHMVMLKIINFLIGLI